MVGKKGMSPIIATILLIAFAVALGAMIMNWSSNLVAGGAKETLCKKADLKVREKMCFQDNSIKVNTVNNGESEIASVILRIKSEEFDQDIEIKNSHLKKGDALVRRVPTIKPTNFELQLVPKVEVGEGETEPCPQPVMTTTKLPVCQ